MSAPKVRVAVNGYGVIGKRVADAVRVQPDVDLVGVSDVTTDYRVKAAVVLGLPVYASVPEKMSETQAAAIPVSGSLDDLLNSFVAQANYASAVGRDSTRVVSCNTTGTVRTIGVTDGEASIALTDQALGMRRDFLVPATEPAPAGQK